MKFPLPRPIFAHVDISRRHEHDLLSLVDVFIDKLLDEEKEFRVARDGGVDATAWKHLRQSENIGVYRERKSTVGREDSSSSSEDQHQPPPQVGIPPLLIVGQVPGSLDDLLYGFTTPSREATLIKTSYVDDGVVDVEVLKTIRPPTLDDPFSHVSVKWVTVAPRSKLIRPRDYVYLDTIGTRTLPNGERIGYRLTHSIDVDGVGSIDGIIRANLSISGVFREAPNNNVLIYGRAFFEPGGDVPRSVFTAVAAMQVTLATAQMNNGVYKKLALALRRTQQRAWTIAVPVAARVADAYICGVCMKKLHLLNKSRSNCALCARRLCHSCRVRKQLSFLNGDFTVLKSRVTFCSYCVQQAISLPSAFAASEEFLSGQEDFYRAPISFRVIMTTSTIEFRSFISA